MARVLLTLPLLVAILGLGLATGVSRAGDLSAAPPGSLQVGRSFHAASALGNGDVLVVGGIGEAGEGLASAERYDPARGSFSPVGAMSTSRVAHTVTLLEDERLLVVGGTKQPGGGSPLASAEAYDPASEAFSDVGLLSSSRSSHTATLLISGEVLIVGGQSGGAGSQLATAERFDSETGQFTPTVGSLAAARIGHTATRLSDGRVLIVGGLGESGQLASVEIYNPATDSFSTAGGLNIARVGHTATLLDDGRVVVIGGSNDDGAGRSVAEIELYNPDPDFFVVTDRLSVPRSGHTATRLDDGAVVVTGGFDAGGATLGSIELFDPQASIVDLAGALSQVRAGHTATLIPDGSVLLVGGVGDSFVDTRRSAELYLPPVPVLTLEAGGQFLFWSLGPSNAAAVFAEVTIAWLFNPSVVDWTSFVPPLGQVDFALADGDVLWVVTDEALEVEVG